jgi:hypothetical protein
MKLAALFAVVVPAVTAVVMCGDSAYCEDGQHCCYDNDGTPIGCCDDGYICDIFTRTCDLTGASGKNGEDAQRMITTKPIPKKAVVGDSPYCEVGHDFGENPCKQDGTDFCCDYSCTYCGPQEYCDQFSPFHSDSGVCNSDYVPPPGTDICANYFEPCTPPPSHEACQLCGGQFHVGQLITYIGDFTFCGDMLGKGAVGVFAGTNMYTRAVPPFLASWDGCTYGDDAPKAGAGQLNLTCGSRDGYDVNSLNWVDCNDVAPYVYTSDDREVVNLSFKKNATVNVTASFAR